MTQSNVPPPPDPTDSYDTAPAAAPPPPPNAAMLNPTPTPLPPPEPGELGYESPTGYPGVYVGPPPDQNAKTMGMLCHLLSLAGAVVPFGNLIGPIVIWQMKKKDHPFIDDQGKESVNFQIVVTIALLISIALFCFVIGMFILPVVGIVALVFSILGGIKANNGEAYRYPFNIRFSK